KPMVRSMGAHDPMEGLISTIWSINTLPEMQRQLNPLLEDFKLLCKDRDWFTDDSLGLGGLLLNTAKTLNMKNNKIELPASIEPEFLLDTAREGLHYFSENKYHSDARAGSRLAFRECGMTLGLNTLRSMREDLKKADLDTDRLRSYLDMPDEIENFWTQPQNREVPSWKDHLDINAVTLSCSLIAHETKVAAL
ncbi:MAG TPA: hypothetical protein VJ911_03440, partial [Cryomorphaceae bacterium]|nr:hypothetical protein [Cryomorphaceae bacterium]